MGKQWGNLGVRVRGVITYSLSPFEQRAFAGAISQGVPNMVRRIRGQFFRVVPPFVIAYMIYDWGEKANALTSRKNPADFEHET